MNFFASVLYTLLAASSAEIVTLVIEGVFVIGAGIAIYLLQTAINKKIAQKKADDAAKSDADDDTAIDKSKEVSNLQGENTDVAETKKSDADSLKKESVEEEKTANEQSAKTTETAAADDNDESAENESEQESEDGEEREENSDNGSDEKPFVAAAVLSKTQSDNDSDTDDAATDDFVGYEDNNDAAAESQPISDAQLLRAEMLARKNESPATEQKEPQETELQKFIRENRTAYASQNQGSYESTPTNGQYESVSSDARINDGFAPSLREGSRLSNDGSFGKYDDSSANELRRHILKEKENMQNTEFAKEKTDWNKVKEYNTAVLSVSGGIQSDDDGEKDKK